MSTFEVTKEMIKELREKSGAGMVDCKNALKHCQGDIEESITYLREKGLASAAKKSGRVASEGLVAALVSDDHQYGLVCEINCETDFVTKTEDFVNLVEKVSSLALVHRPADLEALKTISLTETEGGSVQGLITQKVAVIGENIVLRRFDCLTTKENGYIYHYIHTGGKIGVLLHVETSDAAVQSKEEFQELLKNVSMHIAAAAPLYVDEHDVDSGELAKEKEIYRNQIRDQGKPENIVDKIVEGKIRKYYEEVCLLDQEYIRENKVKVREILEQEGKKLGAIIKPIGFKRFVLGA